jgi:hypothetical protein
MPMRIGVERVAILLEGSSQAGGNAGVKIKSNIANGGSALAMLLVFGDVTLGEH